MSKFTTRLPINVEEILAELPKGKFIHSITWDAERKEVVILWEEPRFHSGLTVATDWPVQNITRFRLPNGVIDTRKKVSAPVTLPDEQNAPTALVAP